MRFLHSLLPSLLVLGVGFAQAASSWSFEDATISVTGKGGTGSAFKDKLSARSPITKAVPLGAADSLKIVLTATESGTAKRPHQAFLLLADQDTGLEATFPFSMKESGKGKVDFTQKDLPVQLFLSSKPLRATLVLAGFGKTQGYNSHVFDLEINVDRNVPAPAYEKPLRYGKLEEIHHIFRADPQSGPLIISLFFVLAVAATVPILFGAWLYLGANIDHVSNALDAAPISHGLFFSSIISMEGLFFLYYYNWTLFQVLPVAGIIGTTIFLSGTKALSEVQSRRHAGER